MKSFEGCALSCFGLLGMILTITSSSLPYWITIGDDYHFGIWKICKDGTCKYWDAPDEKLEMHHLPNYFLAVKAFLPVAIFFYFLAAMCSLMAIRRDSADDSVPVLYFVTAFCHLVAMVVFTTKGEDPQALYGCCFYLGWISFGVAFIAFIVSRILTKEPERVLYYEYTAVLIR